MVFAIFAVVTQIVTLLFYFVSVVMSISVTSSGGLKQRSAETRKSGKPSFSVIFLIDDVPFLFRAVSKGIVGNDIDSETYVASMVCDYQLLHS